MKKIGSIIVFWAMVLPGLAIASDIAIVAQIDKSQPVYVGEAFSYQIILDGISEPAEVDITLLKDFNPVYVGGNNASSSTITIINGRRKAEETKRYFMNYRLTIDSEGTFVIPSLDVKISERTFQTNPLTLTVQMPGKTDKIKIQANLSTNKCYIGQPITLTINWYVFADIGDFNINVPAFLRDDFIFDDAVWQADSQIMQSGAMNINGIAVQVVQKRGSLDGISGALVIMKKVLIPQKVGTLNLDAVSVSADVVVGTKRKSGRRDRFFDDFFGSTRKEYKRFLTESEELTLEVKPLPKQDKPVGFYGLVGKYDIQASALAAEQSDDSKLKVSVGEPITLTIKIGGSDFLKPIKAPDLTAMPGFAENFRIPTQQSTPIIEGNYKVFTQTIRAENENITEIPPVILPYFNAEKGKYVIAKTEPIPLEVMPTVKLTVTDLLGNQSTAMSREVARIKQGISANYQDTSALKDQHFSPAEAMFSPSYAALWMLPLSAMVLSGLIKILTFTTPQRQLAKQRRLSLAKARAQIKSVGTDDYELFGDIMRTFIGSRFNRQAGSLTAEDCYGIVLKNTGDANLARSYCDIIAGCDAGRYSPQPINLDNGRIDKAIELMKIINNKSK